MVSERQISTKNVQGVKTVVKNLIKILQLETTQRFITFTFLVFGVRSFVEATYKSELLKLGFPPMWYVNTAVVGTASTFVGKLFYLKN
jgi:hypothetical protein